MQVFAEPRPPDPDPLGAGAAAPAPRGAQAGASGAFAVAGRGPSLRVRLNTIVGSLMVIFVACLGWLRVDATRQSVLEEIVGSNRVAAQLLGRVSWIVASGGSPAMFAFLEQLGRVRANDITLVDGQGQVLYRSPPPSYKQGRSAPAWFSALVTPPSQKKVFAIGEGSMTIEADPSRAILDGWDDLTQLTLAAALGLVAINAVVFWAVGRTVKPLAQIVDSLQKMQHGDYTARLPPLAGREASLIGESVNRLGGAIEGKVEQRILAHEAQRRLAESREWAQRIEQRLESERRQIATELHNELGQSVTAIRSLAKSLSGRLDPDDLVGREATRLIESEAAHLYDAMHGMIPRLAPLDLDPMGLPEALNELVVTLGRLHPDVQVTLQIQDLDAPVSAGPALTAYRVAQEAVNNAIKHSGGHLIDIVLARSGPAAMILTVDDDGCGLPPPDERAARFGLTGLRERVLALGGVFDASRRPSGGSRISAQLPLQVATP